MVEPRRRCYSLPAVDLRKKAIGGVIHVTVISASKLSKSPFRGSPSRRQQSSSANDDSTMFWAVGPNSRVIAERAEICGKEVEMTVPFEAVNSGEVMDRTLNPQWHHTLEFLDDGSPLVLHVRDHTALLPTYSIGDCVVEYQRFPPNQTADKWIPLQGVKRGKLNMGLSVIDSYKLLKEGQELTKEEIFLGSALGWCIEWLQAYFLVLDDIMDNSHTRRGQPCWFRVPKVGMIAVNDGILLRNHIPRILKNHFRGKAYYVDLLDLFNEVEFQTASGQMIDLITTLEGEKDLSKYTLSLHRRIVQYKTAYYSFYLPVACALLMAGENLDNHIDVKNILVDMGIYFQIQDDYLDCFGDPKTIGKIGTDIEDFKCSWLVVKALELCNEEQKKVLHEHYGKADPDSVTKVKVLYNELNLQGVFADYENKSYEKLVASIEAHPSKAVQAVLKSFLAKIYKRQK